MFFKALFTTRSNLDGRTRAKDQPLYWITSNPTLQVEPEVLKLCQARQTKLPAINAFGYTHNEDHRSANCHSAKVALGSFEPVACAAQAFSPAERHFGATLESTIWISTRNLTSSAVISCLMRARCGLFLGMPPSPHQGHREDRVPSRTQKVKVSRRRVDA